MKNLINVIRSLLLFFSFFFFLVVSRVGYVCLKIIYKWIYFGGDGAGSFHEMCGIF